MEYRKLGNTGLEVSRLSFGASSLGGVFRPVVEEIAIQAVHTALDGGINFIDVSPYYGLTKAETLLGKALKGIRRERYILATKVGRITATDFDFSANRVIASVDESLKRLGVDYVDLIQCHDIEFGSLDQIVNETLPALQRLCQTGQARFIGITGLPICVFHKVLDQTQVDTILSYCHYTLQDTTLAGHLPYLETKGVGIINASPLGMGLLTDRPPPNWHPAAPAIRAACARAAVQCRKKGQSLSQLAIQFSATHPGIATTLVGTADPKEIEQDLCWMDQPLDLELLAEVQALLAPVRDQTWLSGRIENN